MIFPDNQRICGVYKLLVSSPIPPRSHINTHTTAVTANITVYTKMAAIVSTPLVVTLVQYSSIHNKDRKYQKYTI